MAPSGATPAQAGATPRATPPATADHADSAEAATVKAGAAEAALGKSFARECDHQQKGSDGSNQDFSHGILHCLLHARPKNPSSACVGPTHSCAQPPRLLRAGKGRSFQI